MDRKKLSMIAAACGAAGMIAALLPWVSVSMGGLGGASANGFRVDTGWFTFICGGLAGAGALLVYLGKTSMVPLDARQLLLAGVGLFGVAALFTVLRFFDSGYQSQTVGPGITVGASRGIGLFIALIAMIGGTVVCFLAAKKGGGDAA